MAIVGLAVGLGYYLTSIIVTLLLLLVLTLLNTFEQRFIHPHLTVSVTLKAEDRRGLLEDVKKVLLLKNRRITSMGIRRNLTDRNVAIDVNIDTTESDSSSTLLEELSAIKGVHSFKIS